MKRSLGSCNGLLCYESNQKDIIIWNPYTKDHKKIPTPPTPPEIDTESRRFHYMYGFGYDLKTGDFKVGRMANIRGKYSEIAVYSLKLLLWKTYRDIPFLYPFGDSFEDLLFCEGIFHWVEMPWGNIPRMIGSFDSGSETFKEIPLPQIFPDEYLIDMIHVRRLEGCLCLLGSVYMKYCEVWVMKDYGVHESWAKMFTVGKSIIGGFGYLDLKHFKNGLILLNAEGYGSYLNDTKKLTKLKINPNYPPATLRGRYAWPILGSLVSPNLETCLAIQ
ncbi:hypothetical protein MKX03_009736 [Papaver bracteatum]|nr:hypothetical protein MKX03_009736 [Papaver bracteatum]